MMCAFMTPVLKDGWDVYDSRKRSRNSSECSNQSHKSLVVGSSSSSKSQGSDLRRRALGETRSLSYHGTNARPDADLVCARAPLRAYHLSTRNSRNASRASLSPVNSVPGSTGPPKGGSKPGTRHRRSSSSSSLTKFHSKVMDKLRNVLHLKSEEKSSENASDDEVSEVKCQP